MAVREVLSAVLFGLVLVVVPGGITTARTVAADPGLMVSIVVAGVVGGYSYAIWYRSIRKIGVARAMALNISYAMWGAFFAWSLRHAPLTPLALIGCAVVTAGAVLTILSGRREMVQGADLLLAPGCGAPETPAGGSGARQAR